MLKDLPEFSCLLAGSPRIDPLGDTYVSRAQFTARHNAAAKVWYRAIQKAYSRNVRWDDYRWEGYSPGARPDITVMRADPKSEETAVPLAL